MNGTIQENEILFAVNYCRKYKEALSVTLSETQKLYSDLQTRCNIKIESENRDIEKLNGQLKQCQRYIAESQAEIERIPGQIENLRKDNDWCRRNIDATPWTVYDEYYDGEKWVSYIDWDSTYANRAYIARMKQQIAENNEEIAWLQKRRELLQKNVVALKQMSSDISAVIEKKKQLITVIVGDKGSLDIAITNFRGKIKDLIIATGNVETLLIGCAENIHAFGTTMAKINYGSHGQAFNYFVTVNYNPSEVLFVNSAAISSEIENLSLYKNFSAQNVKNLSRSAANYNGTLDDEISRQATEIVRKCIFLLNYNNDKYDENAHYMKEALRYLVAYENTKIQR